MMNISCPPASRVTLCLLVCLALSTTAVVFAAGTGEAETVRLEAYRANLLTRSEERAVGQRLAYLYEQRHTLVKDARDEARLEGVMARLRPVIPQQDFEIKIIRGAQPEAVSFPQGRIYLTTALVALATTDDELAAVIAHEAAHITSHHLSRLIALALALPAGEQERFPSRRALITGQALRFTFPSALDSARLRYEMEADQTASRWLERAGYEGKALAKLLNNLTARLSRQAPQERVALQARITLLREDPLLR